MTPAFLLVLFAAVGVMLALGNWRLGLPFCILVGLLQDPIRKITTGTPAYLQLTFLPIMLAMLVSLFQTQRPILTIRRDFPRLFAAATFFVCCLLTSTIITLSYGLQALPLALLGLFSYGGTLPAMLLGYCYLRRDYDELERPITYFAICSSVLLTGVFLQYYSVDLGMPLLGAIDPTAGIRRWYSQSDWVIMLSGFHRTGEVMGWHAATTFIMTIFLGCRRPSRAPIWLIPAAGSLICVLLSARRKMLLIIVCFLVGFIYFSYRKRNRVVMYVFTAAIVLLPFLIAFVPDEYLQTATTTVTSASGRIGTAWGGSTWLPSIVGPFGYGVGTKTQGMQHLGLAVETPLAEGGLDKVLIELGFIGAIAFVIVGITLFRESIHVYQLARSARLEGMGVSAVFAFIYSQIVTFFTAFQVFGDPLIIFCIGFCIGLMLGGKRLAFRRQRAEAIQGQAQRRDVAVSSGLAQLRIP